VVPTRAISSADAILSAAAAVLAADPQASIDAVSEAAGISRATFYRHFRSRGALLAALDIQPDPGARARILVAAAELVGRDGLRGMSMDELAARAEVSRASVYRLFPGKAAIFEALLEEHSPLDEIERVLTQMADRPPAEVLPAVARAAAAVAGPRIGLLRSIFFEITSQSPDALDGGEPRIRQALAAVGGYLARQMAAGRLRQMHPMLAAQVFLSPMVFHLITRAELDRLGLARDMPLDAAIEQLSNAALRALT
jgi:AcrR family transcriptional regulator